MIITKKWLIDKDFLFKTDFWKEKKILVAERYFPGQKLMIFMTGDGHGKPPFQWTSEPCWAKYLKGFIVKNRVCCHVEELQDKIKKSSTKLVPKELSYVVKNGKVFGWEPAVSRLIPEAVSPYYLGGNVTLSHIKTALTPMRHVSDLGYLCKEYKQAIDLLKKKFDPQDWVKFLYNYQNAALDIRIGDKLQKEMGRKIRNIIDKYPNDVHLITCGAEHMWYHPKNKYPMSNYRYPLYNYLQAPSGCFGIADESNGGKFHV